MIFPVLWEILTFFHAKINKKLLHQDFPEEQILPKEGNSFRSTVSSSLLVSHKIIRKQTIRFSDFSSWPPTSSQVPSTEEKVNKENASLSFCYHHPPSHEGNFSSSCHQWYFLNSNTQIRCMLSFYKAFLIYVLNWWRKGILGISSAFLLHSC